MNTHALPAWHNRNFCQTTDLKVDANDLGIMHGEGLYDVFSIRHGKIFALQYHLERFFAGCEYQQLSVNLNAEQISQIAQELYLRSGLDQCQICIIVTRGVPDTYVIKDILSAESQVMIFVTNYRLLNGGYPLRVCVSTEVKRIPDWAVDQRHKNFARQDFNRAAIECFRRGFHRPILLDEHGYITEGPQFNLGIIKNNEVLSPARNRLSGVTMKVIKELCEDHRISFKFADITKADLMAADDVFATCTLGGILPICAVDDCQYEQSGLQKQLQQLYANAWELEKYTTQTQG